MAMSLRDRFLRDNLNKPITVFLVNGVKLQGVVTEYDDTDLVLTRSGNVQLVSRNAVSTVSVTPPDAPRIS